MSVNVDEYKKAEINGHKNKLVYGRPCGHGHQNS